MTSILEHFNEAVSTPEDVDKIKHYILRLAMQGKLVEQDSNEEPSSVLLEKIKNERETLINEGKIKREKPLASIIDSDIPFEIPSSWTWVRLGDIGFSNIGLTYKPSDIVDKGIPVLRSNNIQDNKICYENLIHVNLTISEKLYAQKGDLLICARNGSKSLVGKSALIEKDGMSFGAFMAIFRSRFNQYIHKFFMSSVLRDQITKSSTTTINQVTQTMLKNFIVPLPPLQEQDRIINRINMLFDRCEQLGSNLVNTQKASTILNKSIFTKIQDYGNPNQMTDLLFAIENMDALCNDKDSIEQLRNCVLSLAVHGKLFQQDSSYEPASVLLEKIKLEKERLIKEKKVKKENALPIIEPEDKPYNLPNGWEWVRLLDVCFNIGDIDHKMPDEVTEGIPYISPRDFTEKGINFENAKKVSLDDFERLSRKIKPEIGDIIFPRYGTIGVVRYVDVERDFLVSYSCATIKPMKKYVSPKYIYYYCLSQIVKMEIEKYTNKTTQPNVGIKSIKQFIFPLPPSEEQERIVDKIEVFFSVIKKLENATEMKEKHRNSLIKALI